MDLRSKLQLKAGQGIEGVLPPDAAPADILELLAEPSGDTPACIVFVTDRAVLEKQRTTIAKAASQDHLTWVAYPKSGQLGTDLNRDTLVVLLEQSGIQPVRQIALDGVWSALRFRPA